MLKKIKRTRGPASVCCDGPTHDIHVRSHSLAAARPIGVVSCVGFAANTGTSLRRNVDMSLTAAHFRTMRELDRRTVGCKKPWPVEATRGEPCHHTAAVGCVSH